MANSLLTIQQVTNESLRLFLNSNSFLKGVDKQYDPQFARDGAKIGDTLKIRLPNDYIVRSGPTFTPQDTVEQSTPLQISNQRGVDVAFSSALRALSLDDYSTRVLKPMMNALAGAVAVDIMSMAESVPNFVANKDGSGNIISPTANTWLSAGALLDIYGVPRGYANRSIVMDPFTQARTVSSLAGLFNNQSKIGKQYDTGEMATGLGFSWDMDQTTIQHTTGAYGTLPTVNGANQSGNAITVSALAGPLNKGDIISFAGVMAVNRTTKQSMGTLATFAVTQNVAAGATSIPIYPALTPPVGGVAVPYQTVSASPANGAAVTCVSKAGEVYRKNLAYDPRAFTMATADLAIPNGVHEAARASYGGVSMRMITSYIMGTDQFGTRLDVLYGYTMPRPEWAVAVADAQ